MSPFSPRVSGRRRQAGAGLIEVILVIAIIGFGIAVVLDMMAPGSKEIARPATAAEAVFLAQDLLEEIRSKAFEDPDLPAGSFATDEAARKDYDDVDDFDGWSAAPPQLLDGTPLTQFGGFTRAATVCNVDAADLDACVADGSTLYKKITATVTAAAGGTVSLVSLRTSY